MKEWQVSGGTIPGIPGVLSGRTNFASFGATTSYADTADLLVEMINEDKYLYEG